MLVLSAQCEGITPTMLQKQFSNMFGVSVSFACVKRFLKRNQNNIEFRKIKLLAKKRAARDIPDHVFEFSAEMERCLIDCKNYGREHLQL
jgi:hypothetical protein